MLDLVDPELQQEMLDAFAANDMHQIMDFEEKSKPRKRKRKPQPGPRFKQPGRVLYTELMDAEELFMHTHGPKKNTKSLDMVCFSFFVCLLGFFFSPCLVSLQTSVAEELANIQEDDVGDSEITTGDEWFKRQLEEVFPEEETTSHSACAAIVGPDFQKLMASDWDADEDVEMTQEDGDSDEKAEEAGNLVFIIFSFRFSVSRFMSVSFNSFRLFRRSCEKEKKETPQRFLTRAEATFCSSTTKQATTNKELSCCPDK